MQIVPTVEQSSLSTAYLSPKWVRIAFDRTEVIFRQCHFFIALENGGADLFRQSANASLERFASYNNVMLIEEVDGPPIPKPEPAVEAAPQNEETSAEVVPAPAKPVSDDDIPF
jgi:hypothetical protein